MSRKKRRTSESPQDRGSFRFARRTSARLGRVPSLIWALVYLILVPLFAALYTFLPSGSFYHTTLRYDSSYLADQKTFEDTVERWARETVTPRLIAAVQEVEGRRPNGIRYYAGYEPDDFWPQLLAVADFGDNDTLKLPFRLGGMVHITYTRELTTETITKEESEGFDLMADCDGHDTDPCKAPAVEKALKPDRYFIGWPAILGPTYKLRRQAKGFNAGADLHMFGRMLYLSAVTITTVGYGDIVPLTNVARSAVAAEAMLGIVAIGLFLNALAHENFGQAESNNSTSE